MPNTAIASDFHQTFYVKADFSSQVAFYFIMLIDILTDLARIFFGKIFHPDIRIDTSLGEYVLRRFQADTIYIGQSNFDTLVSG